MSSNIVGRKIEQLAVFQSNPDETKKKTQKINFLQNLKLDNGKSSKSSKSMDKTKKITDSVKAKDPIIKTIDNILDFQLKTKQRITEFKQRKKSEKKPEEPRNYKLDEKLQDIPSFLEKTLKRISDHDKTKQMKNDKKKKELKEKMKKLEDLKIKAQKEISKLSQKKFEPKQQFLLNTEEDPQAFNEIEEIDIENSDFDEEDNEILVNDQKSKLTNNKFQKNTHVINTKNDKMTLGGRFSRDKENKSERNNQKIAKIELLQSKNVSIPVKTDKIKKRMNITTLKEKELKIESAKSLHNAKFIVLENEIKRKEKELADFEKLMREKNKEVQNNENNEGEEDENSENYKKKQRNFLQKINEKIHKDTNLLDSFEYEKFSEENEDHKFETKDKKKKINQFLHSSNKNVKIPSSALDHLTFINDILENNKENKGKSDNKKNKKSDNVFDLEIFENDIYMYKNLYSDQNEQQNNVSEREDDSSFEKDEYFLKNKPWAERKKAELEKIAKNHSNYNKVNLDTENVEDEKIEIYSKNITNFLEKKLIKNPQIIEIECGFLNEDPLFKQILIEDPKKLLERNELNII